MHMFNLVVAGRVPPLGRLELAWNNHSGRSGLDAR